MKIQAWTPRIYGALLTGHVVVLVSAPKHALTWSYGFVLAVLAVTVGLGWRRLQLSVQHNRPLWTLLLMALLAQAAAFAFLFSDSIRHLQGTLVALDPTFYFCLASLFLTVAASYNPIAPLYRWASVVDAILAGVIVVLFYNMLHRVILGDSTAAAANFVMWMFDAMGLFVSVFATLRFTSTTRADERRYFFILAAFAWADFILPSMHNHFILASRSYLPEILLSLPFALVGLLLSRRRKVWLRGYRPSRTVRYLSASLSPFVLSIALCGLALAQIESSPKLALAVLICAVASYAARTAIVIAYHLSFEDELKRLQRGLQRAIVRDELTGLLNRRGFYQILQRGWEQRTRSQKALTIAMVDIDRFKLFNDTYGHLAGDDCLAAVAHALQREAHQHEHVQVARYGGEEFVVLLTEHTPTAAEAILEGLRKRVESMQIQCARHSAEVITVSIGLASTAKERYNHSEKLLNAADAALYAAKHSGRNRISWAHVPADIADTVDAQPLLANSAD